MSDKFIIRGEMVNVEAHRQEQRDRCEREIEEQDARDKAERLVDIDEVIPKLWSLLRLHEGQGGIELSHDLTAYEMRLFMFQAIAVELTGETWSGE